MPIEKIIFLIFSLKTSSNIALRNARSAVEERIEIEKKLANTLCWCCLEKLKLYTVPLAVFMAVKQFVIRT